MSNKKIEFHKLSKQLRVLWESIIALVLKAKAYGLNLGFIGPTLITLALAMFFVCLYQAPVVQSRHIEYGNGEKSEIEIIYPRTISYGEPVSLFVTIKNTGSQDISSSKVSLSSNASFIFIDGTNTSEFDKIVPFQAKSQWINILLVSRYPKDVEIRLSFDAIYLSTDPFTIMLRQTPIPFMGTFIDSLFLSSLLFAYASYRKEKLDIQKTISILLLALVLAIIGHFASEAVRDLAKAFSGK